LRWYLFNQRIRKKRRSADFIKRVIRALTGVSQVPRYISMFRNNGTFITAPANTNVARFTRSYFISPYVLRFCHLWRCAHFTERLMHAVIAAQRIAMRWVDCKRARMRNLRLIWRRVEDDRRMKECMIEITFFVCVMGCLIFGAPFL